MPKHKLYIQADILHGQINELSQPVMGALRVRGLTGAY